MTRTTAGIVFLILAASLVVEAAPVITQVRRKRVPSSRLSDAAHAIRQFAAVVLKSSRKTAARKQCSHTVRISILLKLFPDLALKCRHNSQDLWTKSRTHSTDSLELLTRQQPRQSSSECHIALCQAQHPPCMGSDEALNCACIFAALRALNTPCRSMKGHMAGHMKAASMSLLQVYAHAAGVSCVT